MVCEPFTQWVLEDNFGLGRPPLEDAGVQVVADVEPYELMKLRLLNASHQALCYLGYLAGYRLRARRLPGPAVRRVPARLHGPGGDADAARRCRGSTCTPTSGELIERFSNPQVRDTVARLCAESSDRIPKWLLPVIRHNLEHDGEIERVGRWSSPPGRATPRASTSRGADRGRRPARATRSTAAAPAQREDPLAFVREPGAVRRPGRRRAVRRDLPALTSRRCTSKGARATLEGLATA